MPTWNPQRFSQGASAAGISPTVISAANTYAHRITSSNPDLPVVLTLKHLSHLLGVPLPYLREVVERRVHPYRSFLLKKRQAIGGISSPRRYRTICVPDPLLMNAQRWINEKILSSAEVHPSSVAYKKGSSIYKAARQHCRASWILKIDIQRFFESIPESAVCKAFQKLGYPDLLAFEFARICTREPTEKSLRWKFTRGKVYASGVHRVKSIGFLPQGAPTSPQIANLVMQEFDESVYALSSTYNLTYSRYADDLIFSHRDKEFSRARAKQFIAAVYKLILLAGFEPNRTKTVLLPPRARKVVLGLLVDRETPRLTKKFKQNLESHVYYLSSPDHGPSQHAARRGFTSVIGLQNHVLGLLAHAAQIEPEFSEKLRQRLTTVNWPI